MSAGIVLVHGYTGSVDDLAMAARQAAARYGRDAVTSVRLPGHGPGNAPVFDKREFVDCIAAAVAAYVKERRNIILLGHSTGGILALSFLAERAFSPALLILAAAPKRIDAGYLERWEKHRSGKENIPFSYVASMVSLINEMGSRRFSGAFPVIIMHGERDELVSREDGSAWEHGSFDGPVRTVIVPSARHQLFQGANGGVAADVVVRAVDDLVVPLEGEETKALDRLSVVEQEAGAFLAASPFSRRHLARSPSGRLLVGSKPDLSPIADAEPVLANIEITTRCNLSCVYCGRSLRGGQGADMPKEMFGQLLGLLPHAYRVTLVGLGEPLLHPRVADFIAEAASRGRRVGIVTNAMRLDRSLSRELLKAGLHSIAFSVDASNQALASEVRPGTELDAVIGNIKAFVELAASTRPISTAVFTAVSAKTAPYLEELVGVVAELGVHVMMMTDLNFERNQKDTVWKNADERTATAVRKAVASAFSKKLPVLSVHGLEEFGLADRYDEFLLIPPGQLYQRSAIRARCFSPWQTIPVNVGGAVTLCDCQPERAVGNILERPFSEIWNGEAMQEHRRRMLDPEPPGVCRSCPRF